VQVIQDEERSFGEMLDRGIKFFNGIVGELEAQGGAKVIPADKASKLP
jgi:alanyl-tRNA synthetase